MQIRDATPADVSGIASLFASDNSYKTPLTSEAIIRKELEQIAAAVVAEHHDKIVGFLGASEFEFLPGSKIVEIKRLFVAPAYRTPAVASHPSMQLYAKIEERINGTFDAAVAWAVCGHKHTQILAQRNGYAPVAFSPQYYGSPDITGRGQAESFLLFLKDFRQPQQVKTERIVSQLERLPRQIQLGTFSNGKPPLKFIDLSVASSKDAIEFYSAQGYAPNGILPFNSNFLIMGYVGGLPFDESKVDILHQAQPLVKLVTGFYNSHLLARNLPASKSPFS